MIQKSYQWNKHAYKDWHLLKVDSYWYYTNSNITIWKRNNLKGRYKSIDKIGTPWYYIYFEKEEDLVLFKMTWL